MFLCMCVSCVHRSGGRVHSGPPGAGVAPQRPAGGGSGHGSRRPQLLHVLSGGCECSPAGSTPAASYSGGHAGQLQRLNDLIQFIKLGI